MPKKNTDPESENGMGSESVTDSFMQEIIRRSQILGELRSNSAGASELAEKLDISRSTIHRATNSLSELNLVEKSEGQFRLTRYGAAIASEVDTFRDRIETTHKLEPFLNHVDISDLPVEHFADADVIQPTPQQPHFSVRRIMELIGETDRLRAFSTVISPFYVEVAHREMLNGMKAEVIFDEQTINIVLNEYGQQTREAIEAGRFDVYIHNDLPFELFLFDDRIGMAAHDDDGIARVFVESSSEEAIAWGEKLYTDYLEKARPIAAIDE